MLAAMASATVAIPDAARVSDAPRASSNGPPIAEPTGVETITSALRAARTAGRFAVVVADWKREYMTGMNGPQINPPRAKHATVTPTGANANGIRHAPQPATIHSVILRTS
jgi:hypothetical protein